MVTELAYIAAYRSLIDQYFDQRATMEEHLVAVQALKDEYLKGRASSELPAVP